MRDFTLKKYIKLCSEILNAGYNIITFAEYLKDREKYDKLNFVIIRHDIDNKVDLPIALEMAKIEKSMKIKSTYYFRTVKDVYNELIIKEINSLGHDIGYHYEVLNETNGDIKEGIKKFDFYLKKMRKICPVETICQHGGALGEQTASSFKGMIKSLNMLLNSKKKLKAHKSINLWNYYKFTDYALLGEAYLSLNFNKIIYFSDTGIRWDGFNNRILDIISTDYYNSEKKLARTTDDLIKLIKSKSFDQINILAHPANWIDPLIPWVKWRILQVIRNLGKKILLKNAKSK